MSFIKQPILPGDVIINKVQTIDATITHTGEADYYPGTPLVSSDGGQTFAKAVDADGVVVNGILGEWVTETATANVLLIGTVKEHEAMTADLTDRMRVSAFANHLIIQGA